MSPTPEGMKRLTIELPAGLHHQLKSEVTRLGLDLRAVIMPLVKSWLSGESKIKIQPAERSFEKTIHPGADGWEKSIEELVDEILKKREAVKEAEKSLEVHTVEPVIPVEKNRLEESAESLESADLLGPEEVEESEEIEENPDEEIEEIEEEKILEEMTESKPKKKKKKKKRLAGIWPWQRVIDVESGEDEGMAEPLKNYDKED